MTKTDRWMTMRVFEDVSAERRRQDAKWGEQNHDPAGWTVILAEELGEAAREAQACRFGAERHGGAADPVARFRAEMVQVAAVAVAAIEAVDRATAKRPPDAAERPQCECDADPCPLHSEGGWRRTADPETHGGDR